jgi:predicted ABC-type ATPase
MPTMYVVAGPPGSGKSTAFPLDAFGCDYFNADNHAAMLNGGSYVGIPRSIRAEVVPICEAFIQDHIAQRRDFATETTFRSPIVFDQMGQARKAGFVVRLIYVCVDNLETSVKRIKQRAYLGGHSASENTIREIRSTSLTNFLRAFDELGTKIDSIDVYDNSAYGLRPEFFGMFEISSNFVSQSPKIPVWIREALNHAPQSRPKYFDSKFAGPLARISR